MSKTLISILLAGLISFSGDPTRAGAPEPNQLQSPGIAKFLTPEGRIDLRAAQASTYQGPLDLSGFNVDFAPGSQEPILKATGADGLQVSPDDKYWTSGGKVRGINGVVIALIEYDGQLIAGGRFSIANDTFANNVASWDGTHWSPMGSGTAGGIRSGQINTFAIYNGQLIAGGLFNTISGQPASRVAAWDGSAWVSLGSSDWQNYGYPGGSVVSLAVYNGNLYAGGNFDAIGGNSIGYIAVWDGASWLDVGGGLDAPIEKMIVYDNKLIVGGYMERAGNITVSRIAAWDGSSWSSMGGGIDPHIPGTGVVYSMAIYDNKLIAAGQMVSIGGVPVNSIAGWDGTSWTPLGDGLLQSAYALLVSNGRLYAGGAMIKSDTVLHATMDVAVWDGLSWSPVGDKSGFWVRSMCEYQGQVIAGGWWVFEEAYAECPITAWNGQSWQPLGEGTDAKICALALYHDHLIAGGCFRTIAGIPANYIAAWDGTAWTPLGTGLDGNPRWRYLRGIKSLAVYHDQLIVGGNFNIAGSGPAPCIAAWDGTSWAPIGTGMDSTVNALAVYDDRLIAGGDFTIISGVEMNHIAAWDGNAWSPVGPGTDGSIYALTLYKNQLIAGGNFVSAGYTPVYGIAAWDGQFWWPLGSGLDAPAVALANYGNILIAGGGFSRAGDVMAHAVAAWDGSSWSALGAGVFANGAIVYSLAVQNSLLYAGGIFDSAGTVDAKNIARWNGISWKALGSGTNYLVAALASYRGHLMVGGGFNLAGGKVAASLAQWNKKLSGDANGDDVINVGDAIYLINYVFKFSAPPNPYDTGDADCDGHINVGDIVYLINFVFKSGPAPSCY